MDLAVVIKKRFGKIDFVAAISLLAVGGLMFLWPHRSPPWASFYHNFTAFLIVLSAALFFQVKALKLSLFLIFCIFVSMLPIFQALFFSYFKGDAFISAFFIASFFISTVLAFNYSNSQIKVRYFIFFVSCLFLFIGLFSALIAIRQWFSFANSIFEISYAGSRPYANLAQPNHLAALLSLSLFSLHYIFERSKIRAWIVSICVVILFIGLIFSQSRTPWVTGLLFLIFWTWKSKNLNVRLTTFWLVVWLSTYLVGYVTFTVSGETFGYAARDAVNEVSLLSRPTIWWMVINGILEEPLTGFGWLQTSVAQLKLVESNPVSGIITYSHNLYLDLLLWNGLVIGGFIVFVFFIWKLKLLISATSISELYAVMFLGVIFIHSMLEYVHAYAYFLLPAGFMLGFLERSRVNKMGRPENEISIPPFIFKGFAGVLLVGSIVAADEYGYLQKSLFNQNVRAADVIGFEHQDFYRPILILDNLEALYLAREIELIEKVAREDVNLLMNVAQHYPHLSNLYRYGLALGLNGRLDESMEQLAFIRVIHGEKYYNLAQTQLKEALKKNDVSGIDSALSL